MKILRFAILGTLFFVNKVNAGWFSSENDLNSEVQKELEVINKEDDISNQMSKLRSLMMKRRKASFGSTTQNMFGNTLQLVFNKRDKSDFHQGRMLKGLLNAAARTPLLGQNQQEYVKSQMLEELGKAECFSDKGRMLSMLKHLDKCRNFQTKNRMLMNFARHNAVKAVDAQVQSLFANVMRDTYSMRPLNDEIKLGYLKKMLDEAVESTVLNEKDKKDVKSILLPELNKNIQTAKLAPQSKDFAGMKDVSTAYLNKNSSKDFDITKNKNTQGPVLIAGIA